VAEEINESAAESLREAFEEILTLLRLKVPGLLLGDYKSFGTGIERFLSTGSNKFCLLMVIAEFHLLQIIDV